MDEVALAPLGGASATGDAATSAGDSRRKQHQLVPPTMLPNGIEYSICSVPRLIRRDLASVLPDVPIEHVLIVPCCQRSCIDLVNLGADVAAEKDRLLEVFAAWARDVRRRLMSDVHKSVSAGCAPERGSGSPEPVATAASTPAGAAAPGAAAAPLPEADVIAGPPSSPTTPGPWADFVDPCSGLPTFTANATVIYPEVDTMEVRGRKAAAVAIRRNAAQPYFRLPPQQCISSCSPS